MKIFKRIGLGFLIIIALLGIWIAINSIDDAELSEQAKEMLKPAPEVPAEENGYELISYIGADNFSVISDKDSRKAAKIARGEEWDTKFIKRLVSENIKIITDVANAIKRPRFKFPTAKTAIDLPQYQNVYQASRLLIFKSKIDANYLNIDSAIETLTINVNFCQKIMTEENHYLISYMIGIPCISDSLDVIHEITSKHTLKKNQFKKMAAITSRLKPYASDDFEKIFPGEIRYTKSTFDKQFKMSIYDRKKLYEDPTDLSNVNKKIFSYTSAFFPKYYFHPNAVINFFSEIYAKAMADVPLYCSDMKARIETKDDDFPFETFYNPLTPYWIRHKQFTWSWKKYFERRCLAHTYYDAVSAIIAIQAYQQDHKKLPKNLNELIPTYMDRLPIDYFNGAPLKYSADDKWLYSVGNDYQDDKGSALGFTRGRCYKPDKKNTCDTNPTFPIDWNEYPVDRR